MAHTIEEALKEAHSLASHEISPMQSHEEKLARIGALRAEFPENAELASYEMHMLGRVLINPKYKNRGEYQDEILMRMDHLWGNFSDNISIGCFYAHYLMQGFLEMMYNYQWQRAHTAYKTFEKVYTAYPHLPKVDVKEIEKSVPKVLLGKERRKYIMETRFKEYGREEQSLISNEMHRRNYVRNPAVLPEWEAQWIADMVYQSSHDHDWKEADKWLNQFEALLRSFPRKGRIAVHFAWATAHAAFAAARNGNKTVLERTSSLMKTLRGTYPKNAEIALEDARIASELAVIFGESHQYPQADNMLTHLEHIRQSFENNPAIALEEALALLKLIAAGHPSKEHLVQRLRLIQSSFPNLEDIIGDEVFKLLKEEDKARGNKARPHMTVLSVRSKRIGELANLLKTAHTF